MPVVIGGIKYKSHDNNIENNMAIDTFLQVSTGMSDRITNISPNRRQIGHLIFYHFSVLAHVNLMFDTWPSKTIDNLFHVSIISLPYMN